MKRIISLLCFYGISLNCFANLFNITQIQAAPPVIGKETFNTGIAIFNVQSNYSKSLTGNGVINLPKGVTQVIEDGYCKKRFDLGPYESCQLKLQINGNQIVGNSVGDAETPTVCNIPDSALYCYYPLPNQYLYSKVARPNQLATVDISPAPSATQPYALFPGQTFVWTVTNTSQQPAYQINAVFDEQINEYIVSRTNTCSYLAPQASCTISVTIQNNAPASGITTLLFVGANTANEIETQVAIVSSGALVASSLDFENPGTKAMLISNLSNQDVFITNVAFPAALHGVTLNSGLPLLCPANTTCNLSFTASDMAYGHGEIDITYTQSQIVFNLSTSIVVEQPTLTFLCGYTTGLAPCGDFLSLLYDAPGQEVILKNEGPFYATGLVFQYLNPVSSIIFDADNCLNPSNVLAPSESCNLVFDVNNPSNPVTSSIAVSAVNVDTLTKGLATDIHVSISVAPIDLQYFQYQGVLLVNNTDQLISLSTPIVADNLDLIHYCGNSCSIPVSAYPTCSSPLLSGNSCVMWFYAEQDTTAALQTMTGDVTLSLTYNDEEYSSNLSIEQQTALYVTGDFTVVGGDIPVNYIAKWDGVNWFALQNGLIGGRGRNFALYAGNLYVAGEFSSAGNLTSSESKLLARWNGGQWQSLPGGTLNAQISGGNGYALEPGNEGQLYVGGTFSTAGAISANSIASWNAITGTWSALTSSAQQSQSTNGLNNTVYALNQFPDRLYIGGSFTFSMGSGLAKVTLNKITAWLPGSLQWQAFDNNGFANNVHAFFGTGSELYTGGNFTKTKDNSVILNLIGVWTNSLWQPLANGLGTNTSQLVYAIQQYSIDNSIYAAGSYNTAIPAYFAYYQSGVWNEVDAGIFSDIAFTVIEQNNTLFVGGAFPNYLASNANNTWQVINNATNNKVYALWAGTSAQFK